MSRETGHGGNVEIVAPTTRTQERLDTGVPNLDRVLGGGLLRGTIIMVIGPPGSGKTILAQQIAFRAADRGETALYFTGYSESHDKLLAHNRSLSYFQSDAIGIHVQMGSLPDLLGQDAEAAERAILGTAQKERASLVILDGFRSMRGFLPGDQASAEFLYALGAKLALLGTTLLVLVEGDAQDRVRDPEQSVCDVILVPSSHRPRGWPSTRDRSAQGPGRSTVDRTASIHDRLSRHNGVSAAGVGRACRFPALD